MSLGGHNSAHNSHHLSLLWPQQQPPSISFSLIPPSPKAYQPLSSQSDFSEVQIMSRYSCAENTTTETRIKFTCRSTNSVWSHLYPPLWPHLPIQTLCCLFKHSNFVLRNFGCDLSLSLCFLLGNSSSLAWVPFFFFLVISSTSLYWCSN